MKKIIIEINKNKEEAKKVLSRYQMFIFNKTNNSFFQYMRKKMKQYIIDEDDNNIICCNEVKDDQADNEIKKLDAFFLGDYKQCEIIRKEMGITLRVFSKLMKLMKDRTVISYFNLFGILVAWRKEDVA